MSARNLAEYSPHRERARHDAIVERILRASPARPVWLLCPREALASALEARVARGGGGFLRVVGWGTLLAAIEDAMNLVDVDDPGDAARTAMLEAALLRHATGDAGTASAMRVDPYGVAAAALGVVDELRLAGWDGDTGVLAGAPRDEADGAGRVYAHLELLADLIRALESGMRATGALDLPGRLARVVAGKPTGALISADDLIVEGIDRVTPLERAVLEAVGRGGARVDVAAWVVGWNLRAPRPVDLPTSPANALEAYARGVARVDGEDDPSIVEVWSRDPDDEADGVARWIAEHPTLSPQDVALAVPGDAGYAPRVARALERYGVPCAYATSQPTQRTPLWQVVRASVRLAYEGADALELAAVLSAPGAGIWGADRDRLCARLRERVPTSWTAVREILADATDPVALAAANEATRRDDGSAGDDAVAAGAELPPERVRQLDVARGRVEELIDLWDGGGPIGQLPSGQRHAALERVVEATLRRFADPMRLQEAFDDRRTVTAWVAAARGIADAARAVLGRVAEDPTALGADPSSFLAPVERLLGTVPDAQNRRRGDGVALLVDAPFLPIRPRVLIVLGFQRGRYPATPAAPLLLGPLEREALAQFRGRVPGLAEVLDEGVRASLAERDARRLLCLPVESLVLVSPRRDAQGALVEPSLSRGDLLAAFPPAVAAARRQRGPTSIAAFVGRSPATTRTTRALLVDLVAAVGRRDGAAVALGTPALAARAPDQISLLAARWRPDRQFALGPLVRRRLRDESFSVSSLETLLKCRYSFLTQSLLRLRHLPVARAPSLQLRDRSAVAHAALRLLEDAMSGGRAPTPLELEAALEAAVRATVPWATRGRAALELEELRRTVRVFLGRYGAIRRAWRVSGSAVADAAADEGGRAVISVALPTHGESAPRTLKLIAPRARVEARGPGEGGVLVELRLGRTDTLARERAAGLGIAAALGPLAAEAQHLGGIAAVANLSLSRAEGDVVARAADGPALAGRAGATSVAVDAMAPLEAFRDATLERLAREFDALATDDAELAPHTRERRAELVAAGARSCENCSLRLGCRFRAGPR